ncbi:MAG: hypothetical protein ACLQVG_06435 [Terriglobia bacterium]
MERNWLNRTKYIAVRVDESASECLQAVADVDQKPLGEWCRDTRIVVASRRQPSPVEFGLLAEMTATQAIVTHLLCTAGRDGMVSTQRAQEIVDKAHDCKYEEALQLLRVAHSTGAKVRSRDRASTEPPEEGDRINEILRVPTHHLWEQKVGFSTMKDEATLTVISGIPSAISDPSSSETGIPTRPSSISGESPRIHPPVKATGTGDGTGYFHPRRSNCERGSASHG